MEADGIDESSISRKFTLSKNAKRKGKQKAQSEEYDDGVYFLELRKDSWAWSKPLILGPRSSQPPMRADHCAAKTNTNEVTVFGGWVNSKGPTNDLWIFNFVDSEWKQGTTSGIQPRPRYRHTCEVIGRKLFILGGSDNSGAIIFLMLDAVYVWYNILYIYTVWCDIEDVPDG